jgi:NADPH:quinone reductase-like Zn-dependent oxidoreductase
MLGICVWSSQLTTHSHGHGLSSGNPSYGAFQQFVLVPSISVSPYPSSIPAQEAVVLPLSISTAAAGLYQRRYLSLPYPSSTHTLDTSSKPHNRTVVIWGGSSSVGSTAIQLAHASGVVVVAVASQRNFDYCRRLGAHKVFDYHSQDIEDDLVKALKGSTLAGVYHAAGPDDAVRTCARVAERSEGKALVVTVRGAPSSGLPGSVRVQAIRSSDIFAPGNEVGPRIWRDYVPGALAKGLLVPAPEPLVVGQGLRSVQHGLDVQKRGVSAAKIVVDGIDHDASKEGTQGRMKFGPVVCFE